MGSSSTTKSISVRNLLLRFLLLGVFLLLLRFFYVFTVKSSVAESFNFIGSGGRIDVATTTTAAAAVVRSVVLPPPNPLWTTRGWRRTVDFYKAVFEDLISDGYLSPSFRCLSVGTVAGQDVYALKEIGVPDAVGISKKPQPPLVIRGDALRQPFDGNTFDFIFSAGVDRIIRPGELAVEICRTLKPEGFFVVHTSSAKDLYSLNSFVDLFDCCQLVRSREIDGPDSSPLREIVLKKENPIVLSHEGENPDGDSGNKCLVEGHKRELVWNAEPLITEEPLKPWITLKKNLRNIRYLPSMADLSFKRKYVYIDVGSRSYGSSIGSWFKKQYPKQNRTFEIYAIEADQAFHDEYRSKKGINLVPSAAWIRNETLLFEVSRGGGKAGETGQRIGRGMGRIRPSDSSAPIGNDVDRIQGFDFANWLKNTVSKKDFVVMKMDVEGTEFDLIPKLFETGAICLIDEIFLECHYNRWQRCCPGVRSSKFQKTYNQCLDLFSSLRESGVLVHQWW